MKTQTAKLTPTEIRRKRISMISLILLTLACIYLCRENFKLGQAELVKSGMAISLKFFLGMIPIIALFAIITGQIKAHYLKKPEHVGEMVSGQSILRAVVAGSMTPGGATMGPVLQDKWSNGGNKFAIIAFLIAVNMINWTTLMFRLPFLGGRLTVVVLGIGMLVTIACATILIVLQRFQTVTT